MRRWTHDVDPAWLKERQAVLTATEVAGLMPEYKRYLKIGDPGKLLPGFASLWAQKNYRGELDTGSPSPAAARGHIMEPWAVKSWNMQHPVKMHHWDDCVICKGILGFSPDAMNIEQGNLVPRLNVVRNGEMLLSMDSEETYYPPTSIMEIKSYDVPAHMKSIIEDKMERKELMQLAMAFAVLPKLEKAYLVNFCPDAPISMHVEEYTADDLHDQCRWIEEIANVYLEQVKLCEKLPHTMEAKCTEREVWDAFVAEQAANSDMFTLKG